MAEVLAGAHTLPAAHSHKEGARSGGGAVRQIDPKAQEMADEGANDEPGGETRTVPSSSSRFSIPLVKIMLLCVLLVTLHLAGTSCRAPARLKRHGPGWKTAVPTTDGGIIAIGARHEPTALPAADDGNPSLPLNESLRALERGLGSDDELMAGALGAGITPTTLITSLESYELADQMSASGQSNNGAHFKSGQVAPDRPRQSNDIKRLLVRQLTNLIMNNEPERIAESVEGTRISGQMLSESGATNVQDNFNYDQLKPIKLSASSRQTMGAEIRRRDQMGTTNLVASDDESTATGSAPFVPSQVNGAHFDERTNNQEEEDRLKKGHETVSQSGFNLGTQEDQTVTCSPDYEDQAMVDAAGGGNLTAEQQQQLLAGVDSSGLILANGSSSSYGSDDAATANQQQAPTRQISQCVQPGSQMIEIITKVITPILFSIIIVVGLLGNIIVMLVILEDRKTERELTPTNLLILDLSLADLSFIIFCIPFTGWDYAVGHWVFGPLWCKFNQYLIVVCALSSIYTLVLMSIDRFMAIVYPIECISYRTSKNMLYAIYIKWIIILLIALPTWTMHGLIDSPLGPEQYNCRFLADQYNPLHFQITFFITSYLFPLALIFGLYLSLLNKLWFRTKPHGHKESLKMLESKKKVTWLVAGIVVVFALCWCPIQVMLILMRLKSHKITATYVAIQVFAHTLGYMNSCINPIVYAFASETFHQSFKRSWLGRLFGCCGANIQHHHSPSGFYEQHNITSGHHHAVASDRLASARNSTIQTSTTGHNSNSNKNRNQSLNHIFLSNNGNQAKRSSLGTEGAISTSTVLTTTTHHNNRQQPCDNEQQLRQQLTASANRPLPLEPRDRPTAVPVSQYNLQLQQQQPTTTSSAIQMHNSPSSIASDSKVQERRSQTPTSGAQVLIPRQPTASGSIFEPTRPVATTTTTLNNSNKTPAKQQLIARMVNQSNGNQISHQCEPCDP